MVVKSRRAGGDEQFAWLGPSAQDNAGDPVVLWGEGLPVETYR